MPLDFCENNWKSLCACRLTENEHKKRQKVQKEKDEIGERTRPKITEKTENRHPWVSEVTLSARQSCFPCCCFGSTKFFLWVGVASPFFIQAWDRLPQSYALLKLSPNPCHYRNSMYESIFLTKRAIQNNQQSYWPSLKEVLRPVGCLQTEDVLFLGVVTGFGGQGMVDANHIVWTLHKLPFLHLVLILVLIQDQVTQNGVHHAPPSLSKRGCNTTVPLALKLLFHNAFTSYIY